MVAKTKKNRAEDLALSRQSLTRLKTFQNFVRRLEPQIEQLVKNRTRAADFIQSIQDETDIDPDQCETNLRVTSFVFYISRISC